MRVWSVAALVLGAGLAFAGTNQAKADYAFDLTCSGSSCSTGGSLGTLNISTSSTEIVYSVHVNQGSIWDSGITTFFAYVTGSITSATVSGTNAPAPGSGTAAQFTSGVGNNTAPGTFDGLSSSLWDVWANCSRNKSTNCGTDLTLTVDGSGLAASFVTLNGFNVYAGLDVSCNNNTDANTACSQNGALTPGQTGAVGATAVAVPGPVFGAGLPGLVAACAGLLAFARRRRKNLA